MRIKRLKLDNSLVTEWASVIAHEANHSVRVIACDELRVIDFLGQLRFRYSPSTTSLSLSYRSPTGFWLDAPNSLHLSAQTPLQWLWTKYWLAHRRAEIAALAPHASALQFATLCDDYAKALLKALPLSVRRALQRQLCLALSDNHVTSFLKPQQELLTSSPWSLPERRSFRALLAAIGNDDSISAPA